MLFWSDTGSILFNESWSTLVILRCTTTWVDDEGGVYIIADETMCIGFTNKVLPRMTVDAFMRGKVKQFVI